MEPVFKLSCCTDREKTKSHQLIEWCISPVMKIHRSFIDFSGFNLNSCQLNGFSVFLWKLKLSLKLIIYKYLETGDYL